MRSASIAEPDWKKKPAQAGFFRFRSRQAAGSERFIQVNAPQHDFDAG